MLIHHHTYYERRMEIPYNCKSKEEDILASGFCIFHDKNYLQDKEKHDQNLHHPTVHMKEFRKHVNLFHESSMLILEDNSGKLNANVAPLSFI
jgi:hypothetical protein